MNKSAKLAAVVLLVLIAAAGWAYWRTGQAKEYEALRKARRAMRAQPTLVDQSALKKAQEIARMPTSPEERPFAQEALRLSDFGVDLAFAQALRDAKEHPPALSQEAARIQRRLLKAENALQGDKARIDELDTAMDKASGEKKDALDEQLDLVKAEAELDQDEVDDAKQDLIAAGGDPEGRIQAMQKEHENLGKNASTIGDPPAAVPLGLIFRARLWWMLRRDPSQQIAASTWDRRVHAFRP